MALPYKPGPQARYLVNKMAESEKTLIDAVNRLLEKLDGYDKRFSSIGLDILKVQSQVDLAMRSIQVLQKEQVLLIKSVESVGGSSTSAHTTSGVIGPAPTSSSTVPAHPQSGDQMAFPLFPSWVMLHRGAGILITDGRGC
jgi:hypothetical protein